MTLLSVIIYLLLLYCGILIALRMRPMAIYGTLPMAFAYVVGFEALVMNILSINNYINRTSLLIVNICAVVAVLVWDYTSRQRRSRVVSNGMLSMKRGLSNSACYLVLPLIGIVILTAILYPPNTYDSLTYHMPRVLHWLQNGSVAYFDTPINRQNVMGPGLEYILLLLQAISGSDNLANLLQATLYLMLLPTLLFFCRILAIPKSWRLPVVALILSTPIIIYEASSTKNDIAAAMLLLAILIASKGGWLKRDYIMRRNDFFQLGTAIGAAFLVKPTAVVVALPFLGVVGVRTMAVWLKMKRGRGRFGRNMSGSLVLCILAFILIAGPDIWRKAESHMSRHEVYPLSGEYTTERLWNPVRVFAHNFPFPEVAQRWYKTVGGEGELITKDVFNPHEDMVGNPYQAVVFLVATILTFVFGVVFVRQRFVLAKVGIATLPLCSWFVFGLMVRDQAWITRLLIPLFILLPVSFFALTSFFQNKRYAVFFGTIIMTGLGIASVAYGFLAGTNVKSRPLALVHFWGEAPNRTEAYYNTTYSDNVSIKGDHDFFLKKMQENECDKVGLVLGPDSVEYPLSLRAMQMGATVRHLWSYEYDGSGFSYIKNPATYNWACIIYVAYGSIEHVPDQGARWMSAGDYHTFSRNFIWEYDNSAEQCFTLDHQQRSLVTPVMSNILWDQEPDGEITVIANGNDPQLLLGIQNRCGVGRGGVMRLEMVSPDRTVVQVFYKTEETAEWQEQRSIKKELVPGENIVYFFLPEMSLGTPLRLDPGKTPGSYVIKSLSIRQLTYE